MLVLDTNVISETMRTKPNGAVVKWIDSQPPESMWTTSVTVFEILAGIEQLPKGKRKSLLKKSFQASLVEIFDGRVLDFDVAAATSAADIAASVHRGGQTVEIRDIEIAGIVASRQATLVTRNVKDFRQSGIHLIDPWNEP